MPAGQQRAHIAGAAQFVIKMAGGDLKRINNVMSRQ